MRGAVKQGACVLCSEAYDQNDQGPIVVLGASRGDRIVPGRMVCVVGCIVWQLQWCSQAQ